MNIESHGKSEAESCSSCEHGHDDTPLPRNALVIISGALLTCGMLLQWLKLGPSWIGTTCFALATLAGGLLVFPAAFKALKKARLDMNVLMTVAVTGAWLVGEGAEGAAVVFLFALSELLESWSVGRARRAIASLLKLTPQTALVRGADGVTHEVPVAEVAVGTEISVRSGSSVPLDGEVITGDSAVNQAPITGESVPVEKKPGDPVFAGTINGEGSLTVRVTKASNDSTLARIIKLVEEAEEQKAPTQRFVDKFAAIYTPAVFVVALLVALLPPLLMGAAWSEWTYRALVLLVIACPCALVIATPVSIVSGLTALARRGVLIKGGAYLEAVGKLRALAVDKTGTITQGRPQVTGVIALGDMSEEEILRRAAAIDAHSEHPLAKAVVTAAQSKGISWSEAMQYQSVTGRGATAVIDGHPHFIGNHKMAHELGICSPEIEARLTEIESKGQSLAILGHAPHDGCAGAVLGILAIGDTIRPEVSHALTLLHDAGIEKVVMLSGDNQRTVDAIARQAGIDEAYGDLMPEQKIEHIKRLMAEHHSVGMIGDGVNDAPALALASVGIAMGAIGSDTAIETADMALMKDDLTRVAEGVALGRRTLRIIQFNVAFALVVKAVFLILAFTGHTSLWLAILADTGATLLVIMNALRLLGETSFRTSPIAPIGKPKDKPPTTTHTMKTLLNILIIAALATTSAFADAKVKAGPRKGLLLELGGKSAEFFVEKDRSISIAVYDAALKAQPATTEVITATAEAHSGKVKIEFEKKGDLLVSKTKLPEGEGYQVVLQAKSTPEAKTKNFRIKLQLYICKGCGNPEYACTCDE